MQFLHILLLLFLVPIVGIAHTSDERYVDGIIVDLSTAPISPLSGENTGFLISFLKPEDFTVRDDITDVTIEVVANERASGKQQEVIFTSEKFPVRRGTLNWNYTFTEPGIYDVHVTFSDIKGFQRTTGFRRQVRDLTPAPREITVDGIILGLALGVSLGAVLGAVLSRQHSRARV